MANTRDLITQLGYIIFVVDGNHRSLPLVFKSYKARRVFRSAMDGEFTAFSDIFDQAGTLADEFRTILNREVLLHLLTDSKSMSNVISKGSKSSEERMILDIAAGREVFRD